jgi:multiple sugar transport system substrate-binding protein
MIGATLATLMAGSLAACSSGGTGTAAATPGTGKLGMSWYGGDPVHKAMQKLVADYMKKYPDLDITVQYSAANAYWDRLATETAGRSAPDVMRMSMAYLSDYANRGALLDLTPYVKQKKIDISSMSPDIAKSAVKGGKYYGISQDSIANAMFVNRPLIGRLGAPDLQESWTWSQFADWAKGVGSLSAGHYGSEDPSGNLQLFVTYVRSQGKQMFKADNKTPAFTPDMLESWWAYWEDMRKNKGAPPASVTAAVAGFNTWPLSKGITPVGFGWVQQLSFVQPFIKDAVDIVMPPNVGEKNGLFVKCLDFWSVASTSKNADEAARLIDFLVNDEDAIKTIGVLLGVPPSQRAISLLTLDPDSPEAKAVQYMKRVAAVAPTAPPPWPAGYNQLQTLFTKLGQDIAFGRTKISAARASFLDAMKKDLT